MVFSSLAFLFFFLPGVLLLHTLLPTKWRNAFLLAASLLFYAWGDLKYLPLIAGLTILNWLCGRLGRTGALIGTLLDIAALLVYKYAAMLPFVTSPPALPLGISFYIFQSISYLLDVRAKRVEAEKNLLQYAAYILLFPQLIAGPIVRYSDVSAQLHQRHISAKELESGMRTFLLGLCAKVLLANRIGAVYTELIAVESRGAIATLFALVAFGFQLYYDFWGYSMMAIGIGRMLGFRFPDNFRHPFASASIREFWQRWHMTLGSWLKTYIYIPLGGSKKGKARLALNLLITWGISGLWHGAGLNFLYWGLYFGLLILLENLFFGTFLQKHRRLGVVYTFILVTFSWLLFSQTSSSDMLDMLRQLINPQLQGNTLSLLLGGLIPLGLGALFAVPKICELGSRLIKRFPLLLLPLLALCVCSLIASKYNPFIYFRF